MADIVNLSNAESPLYSVLTQTSARDPWTYSVRSNVPSFSKSVVDVNVSNPDFGKNHTIELPRYGLLSQAVLRAKITLKGDSNGSNKPAVIKQLMAHLIKRCDLQTHNKVIESTYALYHQAFHNELPYGQRESEKLAGLEVFPESTTWTTGATETNTATGYLRLPLSFMYRSENFLDLRFLEQLSINIETDKLANVTDYMDTTGGCKIDEMFLSCQYISPEEDTYREYQNRNFTLEKNLTMLFTNRYQESPVTSTSSPIVLNLACQNLIFKTHIILRDNAKVVTADGANMLAIDKVTVEGSGRKLYEIKGDQLLLLDGSWGRFVGASSGTSSDVESRVYTITWGLDSDRSSNSGAVSLKNITAPRVTVESSASVTTFRLDVIHEFWSLVDVSGSDGRLSTGINL